MAAPGAQGVPSSASRRRMLSSTRKYSAGHSSSGAEARIRSQISSTRSRVRRESAMPFTSSAGPWSQRPVHEVVPVDMFLPGCPPPADRIRAVLEQVLAGKRPVLAGRDLKAG